MMSRIQNTLTFTSAIERSQTEIAIARMGYYPLIKFAGDRMLAFEDQITAEIVAQLLQPITKERT